MIMDKDQPGKLPLIALLALTVTGFTAIITETLPAGLLPQISEGLGISRAYTGQFITAYALGSVLAAIPIISLTRNWNRKPLLLMAVGGFVVFNLATFLLHSYALLLTVRFLAGVSAGIIWGLLTGYTVRMVAPEMAGKALAIVGVGQPLALSLGVPMATWLGKLVGWNTIFLMIAVLSVILLVWIVALVPDFSITKKTTSVPFKLVFSNGAIKRILAMTLCWILGHNLLYTYVAPYLKASSMAEHIDWMLFLFGISSILGIWLTGYLIDTYLRKLIVVNLILFIVAGLLMWLGITHHALVYVGVALWGYAFGGAPTLMQKDLADVAGEHIDIAQAIFVTAFNSAIAGGGFLGGILLEYFGVPYVIVALIFMALVTLTIGLSKRTPASSPAS